MAARKVARKECAWCKVAWADDFPDEPGAVLWCGECDRAAVRETLADEMSRDADESRARYARLLDAARETVRLHLGPCACLDDLAAAVRESSKGGGS